MTIALTGGGGFLGWHVRVLLHAIGERHIRPIPVGDGFDVDQAAEALTGADRAIHLAGVNRGNDDDVYNGNVLMAEQLAQSLDRSAAPPPVVAFANSSHVGTMTPYANAKQRAADTLERASERNDSQFVNAVLPNLFGEHGRPFYNAVTATFCHSLAKGEQPTIDCDNELTLMHAQNAAELVTGILPIDDQPSTENRRTVSHLLATLTNFAAVYANGDIPELGSAFDRDLFNTYRSYAFGEKPTHALAPQADSRGAFTEVIRSRAKSGQFSFSRTVPGMTRGQHYHRRKIERFAVMSGEATISLRRMLTKDSVTLRLSGEIPTAVDMPTLWAHNIANVGKEWLMTLFWSDEIFDASSPDTIPESV